EKAKKSKSGFFVAMIAFYGLLGLIVAMAAGGTEAVGVPDPGPGVALQGERTPAGVLKDLQGGFLQWMTRMPLQQRATEDQWRQAVDGWWTAKEREAISPALRARIEDRAKEDAGLRSRRALSENEHVAEADRIWSRAKSMYGASP